MQRYKFSNIVLDFGSLFCYLCDLNYKGIITQTICKTNYKN
jgi:hypothetical protein